PALVLDVVELALDVVGVAVRREREHHVQEVRAVKAERGAAVDVRAANAPEALLERGGCEPEMALRLDIAAGADVDVSHNPPPCARSRLRPPWSPAPRPASRRTRAPTARRTPRPRSGLRLR